MPATSRSRTERSACAGTPEVTVGLSLHRPDMLPWIADRMSQHAAIFLEEPRSPGFQRMLTGKLAVEDYLLPLDVEYPDFSRAMCRLLGEMHAAGKALLQVEPFVEALIQIQEFFAEGGRPEEVAPGSLAHHVYRAERAATGALLAYYQTVMTGSFEDAVAAVIRFARLDAARFRLRDSLRAQELARLVRHYRSAYVEAGRMHYQLPGLLRRLLPASAKVRPVFLERPVLRSMNAGGHLYSPGDRLTLLYVFHPALSDPAAEQLLAAQSMIYSKILDKQEAQGAGRNHPHLRDELTCIAAVRRLSREDCSRLFPVIRGAGSLEARRALADFLPSNSPGDLFV